MWTWPDSFSLKEDIKCKEISWIDAVHNRTMTLAYEFKGVNDATRGQVQGCERPHDFR